MRNLRAVPKQRELFFLALLSLTIKIADHLPSITSDQILCLKCIITPHPYNILGKSMIIIPHLLMVVVRL